MSARTIYFAMGFHNHQPVGNFDYVLEDAYKKSYLPLLECIERHPSIKAALHYTGPLWDSYRKSKPEFMEKLNGLVKNGQVEMLSGGYYEPILVNISDRDKISQIKKMNRFLRRELNAKPNGMWCAERVWEPSLARPISLSDIKYTILDESHFHNAGLTEEETFGYFATEEQGHPLAVIPINYNLRQMIPFCTPEEVIDYLSEKADEEEDRLALFADDGEKFGVWPGTYKHVWEERWLDKFFTLLEKNSEWLKVVTPTEYMEMCRPAGRVYLPTASYFEMGAWSLPSHRAESFRNLADEIKDSGQWQEYGSFLNGGFWRNFLVKYPESNRIQKKALYVSEKVQRMIMHDKPEAEDEVMKGQCNCAYWHGVFGGIYLPHLRHAIQECLIKAENFADEEFHKGEAFKEVETVDINRDMSDEVIINTKNIQVFFAPDMGGALYELDYKPLAVNVCDTITRREESYHESLRSMVENGGEEPGEVYIGSQKHAKEKNLGNFLQYDDYERLSFIDHFMPPDTGVESFKTGEYEEYGDFIEESYDSFASSKDDKAILTLARKGSVLIDETEYPVEIEKTFFVPENGRGFNAQYWIINNSDEDLKFRFGCELDFSLLSKETDANYLMIEREKEIEGQKIRQTDRISLLETGEHKDLERISLRDGHRGYMITLSLGHSSKVWHFPIETVSMSEGGFEKVFQSTVVMPFWDLELSPGESWDVGIEINIDEVSLYEDERTEEIGSEGFSV